MVDVRPLAQAKKAEHQLLQWDGSTIYTCREHTYKRLAGVESAWPISDCYNAPGCIDCTKGVDTLAPLCHSPHMDSNTNKGPEMNAAVRANKFANDFPLSEAQKDVLVRLATGAGIYANQGRTARSLAKRGLVLVRPRTPYTLTALGLYIASELQRESP
jgi:hypothetical protein